MTLAQLKNLLKTHSFCVTRLCVWRLSLNFSYNQVISQYQRSDTLGNSIYLQFAPHDANLPHCKSFVKFTAHNLLLLKCVLQYPVICDLVTLSKTQPGLQGHLPNASLILHPF